jgi:hypothetical protein
LQERPTLTILDPFLKQEQSDSTSVQACLFRPQENILAHKRSVSVSIGCVDKTLLEEISSQKYTVIVATQSTEGSGSLRIGGPTGIALTPECESDREDKH